MSTSPSRFTIFLCLFWLVFIVVVFSDAAAHFLAVVFAVCFLGLWVLVGCVRAVMLLIDFLRSPQHLPRFKKRQKLLDLGVEFAAIGLSLGLVAFNIPLSIRLKLSEPALMSYVQEIRAGRRSPQQQGEPARQIGLFKVQETEVLHGGIVRLITAEDFVDHAGLVYSPQQPPIRGEDTYRHLYGSWWHWHRSW